MHAWEAIQKTIDFAEENIGEELKIEALAKIAALSPFYFQRLFKRLVKKPVKEYIKLRRLARASDLLIRTEQRIIDVALEVGFSSHESFTRSFKEAYEVTPDQYRRKPTRLNHFSKPELLLNYTMIEIDVPLITEGIVLEITRKSVKLPEVYIGLSSPIPSDKAPVGFVTGIDSPGSVWDSFHKHKVRLRNEIDLGVEVGVSFNEGKKDGEFNYFAGAVTKNDLDIPEGFDKWILPAGEYVVCCVEAETIDELVGDALGKAINYLLNSWLANRGLVTRPFLVEKYDNNRLENAYMEIWVKPESKQNS
ncbi:AraC family transcriptional regulator [Tindallia californiensis]|uniref:AraC family transcriptional regulator n=1 Tax=Tindallia californiensis TaxID=159292 RepID=A0A1H3IQ00_9FIRM|nr:AraC family transcriptional regulator [Tindallia californiensis]SDY29385.1 AraC family transcriptional regulator [Tindallia californiensis]